VAHHEGLSFLRPGFKSRYQHPIGVNLRIDSWCHADTFIYPNDLGISMISPDGKWRWDGIKWVPITQQNPILPLPQQMHRPNPQRAITPVPIPRMPVQPSRISNRKWIIWGLAIWLVLVLMGDFTFFVAKEVGSIYFVYSLNPPW
jgi:hypothetical protein